MLYCEKCGKPLHWVEMEAAFQDGNRWILRGVQAHDDGTTEVETDMNWLGNGAAKASDHIRCPRCKKFPFSVEDTASCYVIHNFMFADNDKQEDLAWQYGENTRRRRAMYAAS